ncbi:hypothetical protein BH18ACT6_BH18ACT6_19310 [soil metagenome]|nr:hypothetical protein [Actinomycetota bacterium]
MPVVLLDEVPLATGFLPVVLLDEVPLATGFLPAGALLATGFLPAGALLATGFLPAGALLATDILPAEAFLAAAVAPEVVGRVCADGVGRRLVTTLRTPGPGMRLVSLPVFHRTVIMAPLTAVTTPDRGFPFDATAI